MDNSKVPKVLINYDHNTVTALLPNVNYVALMEKLALDGISSWSICPRSDLATPSGMMRRRMDQSDLLRQTNQVRGQPATWDGRMAVPIRRSAPSPSPPRTNTLAPDSFVHTELFHLAGHPRGDIVGPSWDGFAQGSLDDRMLASPIRSPTSLPSPLRENTNNVADTTFSIPAAPGFRGFSWRDLTPGNPDNRVGIPPMTYLDSLPSPLRANPLAPGDVVPAEQFNVDEYALGGYLAPYWENTTPISTDDRMPMSPSRSDSTPSWDRLVAASSSDRKEKSHQVEQIAKCLPDATSRIYTNHEGRGKMVVLERMLEEVGTNMKEAAKMTRENLIVTLAALSNLEGETPNGKLCTITRPAHRKAVTKIKCRLENCAFSSERSNVWSTFANHLYEHWNLNAFQCGHCPNVYARKSDRKRHQNKCVGEQGF